MNPRVGLRVGAALLATLLLGFAVGVYADQAFPDQIFSLVRRSTGRVDTTELQQAIRVIQANYVDTNVDAAKLSRGTVRGLVAGLGDPFSAYYDPDEYKKLQDSYNSRYSGIGVYLRFGADYPLITGTVKGSPADKAGLKAGDRIARVGSKDMKGATSDLTTALIQGPNGTSVTLTIKRDNDSFGVTLVRTEIQLPSVRSAVIGNHVLYVRIFSFSSEAPTEFAAALASGLPGATGVVLDLRDDGGGFISVADDVISEFIANGETFELRDRTNTVERHTVLDSHTENGRQVTEHLASNIRMVVLVNGNSASASEMVSGSLQVHQRAKLVGTKTFGKGSVQQDYQLSDGADIHLTIKRWYLPNGQTIDRKGLMPDVEVSMPDGQGIFDVLLPDADYTADPQLTRALEVLSGG